MQGLVRRGDADEAVRVAAPCRTRPSEDSSAVPPADTRGRTYRSLAPRKTGRLPHGQAPRSAQSRARGPSGWPLHRGARRPVPALPDGPTRPRAVPRDGRNFRGRSPPKPRFACDELPALPNDGTALPPPSSHSAPPEQVPHRNGIQAAPPEGARSQTEE